MDGVSHTGFLNEQELTLILPTAQRLLSGPVAVLECVQPIPCNPCETSCPHHAITIGSDITALPKLDSEKCRGCKLCISKCPGLAIFVVDATYSEAEGLVSLPYEYWPYPAEGEIVRGLDRCGQSVCEARVIKIDQAKRQAGTTVITLAVPQQYLHQVRNLALCPKPKPAIVCRCSEVTEEDVRQAVRAGAHTITAVKLATRAGMGLCQGRTCRRVIGRIITEETGQQPADILPATIRPPVRTVTLGLLAGGDEIDDKL